MVDSIEQAIAHTLRGRGIKWHARPCMLAGLHSENKGATWQQVLTFMHMAMDSLAEINDLPRIWSSIEPKLRKYNSAVAGVVGLFIFCRESRNFMVAEQLFNAFHNPPVGLATVEAVTLDEFAAIVQRYGAVNQPESVEVDWRFFGPGEWILDRLDFSSPDWIPEKTVWDLNEKDSNP